jgi:uncharacterized protein YaeQ
MLYGFRIELSDIDRGIYETLEFRTAQHPSEGAPYLLSRVLAYALSYQDNLEFAPGGLSDPEAPALKALGVHGAADLWIEIGNPSPRKLHKACKVAKKVIVYTYKNPELLRSEIKSNEVHRGDEILIYAFDSQFLSQLERQLQKNNRWSVLHQGGQLDVSMGALSFAAEVRQV